MPLYAQTSEVPDYEDGVFFADFVVGAGWSFQVALGQRVRIAAELRELNRIGVNLNQMARALNSRAVSSPAETQAAVERVGELVAKLLAGERE